jgi:low affinity Fe/Cu permease
MVRKIQPLSRFLTWSAKMAGNPITFAIALLALATWLMIGLVSGFSDTWLLIINTIATVNAALMVFIIQNTQIRESKALHLKIDELIRVTKEAANELIAIEEKEEEIEKIKMKLFQKKEENHKKTT